MLKNRFKIFLFPAVQRHTLAMVQRLKKELNAK